MMISNLPAETSEMFAPEAMPAFLPDGIEAYCVKCKTTHTMVSPQLVTTRTGKLAARGKCQVCGTTVMKFLPVR